MLDLESEPQPKTFDEALLLIYQVLIDHIKEIESMSEEQFMNSSHFGIGGYLRNAWCLWWFEGHPHDSWPKKKPKVVEFFNELGINHADDMSSILLVSFHRKLTSNPIHMQGQVQYFKEFWEKYDKK